jgi:hypothetical protein
MVDLNRALRPLLDQPPVAPEPLEELKARARQRRRRRRVSFAAALTAAVAIVVTVGAMWPRHDEPNRIETAAPGDIESSTQPPLLPTRPVVVATGEIDGHPWRLQANETESGLCVNLLEGGRACFDLSAQPALGVAVDFTVTEDATGTGRVSVAAVYGPVRPDVARIAIRLASGEVVETSPVGQGAGFTVNFYVAHAPTDIPADSELSEIIVYDATGNEIDRLEPRCAPVLADGPMSSAPATSRSGAGATLGVQIRADGPCR